MHKAPITEANALWKKRYRTGNLYYATDLKRVILARWAPQRGLIISDQSGTGQLYAWDISSGILRQLTHSPGGVFAGTIAPDGHFVYYLRDEGGNEMGHYVRIPWEGGEAQDLTPDMPAYAAIYRCAVSDDGTVFAFTPAETSGFPLYCLSFLNDGSTGIPRELYRSPKFIDDVALSHDARLVAVATTEQAETRRYRLLVMETMSGQHIEELSDEPYGSVRAVCFSPRAGDDRLLCLTDRSGYTRPLLWNPRTGERIELAVPDLEGDLEPFDWSTDARRILLRQTWQAVEHLYTYDLETGSLTRLEGPAGAYLDAAFGLNEQVYTSWNDATHSPQLLILDASTGAMLGTLLPPEETLPGHALTSVHFCSSDGVELQGWLGLPDGDGPFPTIVSLHGGPLEVTRETYDPDVQAWLDHGYAYLALNYRGSTTFGREFKEKIWGNLGHWEVEDIVAAHRWLIINGIAQPNAIFVTGASYGGYLTLMALGKYPHLWAGGMAIMALADLTQAYNEGSDWTKGYLTAMLGGTPEEIPEQYRVSSPLTYAERISAPVLMIQGRNDMRSTPHQIELFAKKIPAQNQCVEIDWFDMGHGGITIEGLVTIQEHLLAFAHQTLTRQRL